MARGKPRVEVLALDLVGVEYGERRPRLVHLGIPRSKRFLWRKGGNGTWGKIRQIPCKDDIAVRRFRGSGHHCVLEVAHGKNPRADVPRAAPGDPQGAAPGHAPGRGILVCLVRLHFLLNRSKRPYYDDGGQSFSSFHTRTQSTRQKSGSCSGTMGTAHLPNSVVSFKYPGCSQTPPPTVRQVSLPSMKKA